MISICQQSLMKFQVECFRRLLACGLNVDIGECRYRRSPAHVSAFAGHPHMLLCLLQAGADPNKQVSFVGIICNQINKEMSRMFWCALVAT